MANSTNRYRLFASLMLAFTGVLVVLSANASGASKLDRDTAKSKIVAALKAGPKVVTEFETGKLREHADIPTPGVGVLAQKGMVTVVNLGQKVEDYQFYRYIQVDLTPEGRQYLVEAKAFRDSVTHETVMYNRMRLADEEILLITGILESPAGDSAQVEFTWKYANLTPFGEVASALYTVGKKLDYNPDTVYKATVIFKRYDDGWRLPDGWSLPQQRTGYEQITQP